MTGTREFFKNGLLLSAVALLMRGVSLGFHSYITARVGAEGMGLLSLTMNVYAFAVTFATSGISLAVTRLVAAAVGRAEGARARRILRCAVGYALLFGGTAAVGLYISSDAIARLLLCDIRTRSSLRLLSVSLVPIALSAVYVGYFSAVRRVKHNAVTQVFEQTVKICLTLGGLWLLLPLGLEYACLAMVGGSSIAEFFSFFLLYIQARRDLARHPLSGGGVGGEMRQVAATALPCAVSAHLRSGLVTIQHLLIPFCLADFGGGRGEALASYAALHSMALPVVLFPTAVVSAFSGLLIPECAELEGRGERGRLGRVSGRALTLAVLFSVGCAAVLGIGGEGFGLWLYGNADAGRYITWLAPLVPVMYLDSVVDAHLKGMGYQVYSMGINILDAAVSVGAVLLLLPRFGAEGYIAVIYITELLNFILSAAKLFSLVHPRICHMLALSPVLALLAVLAAFVSVRNVDTVGLACRLIVTAAGYLGALALLELWAPPRAVASQK